MTKTETKVIDLMAALKESLAEPEPRFIPCPAPGIYPDIPAETYHRWDAASNSQLTQLRRSPAHLKAYLEAGREDTDAFRIGRAFHALVLEPDFFADRWPVAEQCSAITQKKTQCSNSGLGLKDGAWVCGTHGGVERGDYLKQPEYTDIVAMASSVLAMPRFRKLFHGEGRNELSLVWDDPATGVRCKCRIDRHHPTLLPGGVIADLKSTRDASRQAFERSAYDTGIYRQAAMYLRGANICGLKVETFAVIACEKEPPYCTAGYAYTSGSVDAGEAEVDSLLTLYKKCKDANRWPGYSENFEPLALPHYAWGQVDEATEGAA